MVAEWPRPTAAWEDVANDELITQVQEIIGVTRNIRAEYGVPPAQRVSLRITGASDELHSVIHTCARILTDLARVADVEFARRPGEIGASAVLTSGTELFVPLGGVIDLERERGRLRSELERIGKQVEATENRLANESFVGRAPAQVVEREREKVVTFREQREKLTRSLAALEGTT